MPNWQFWKDRFASVFIPEIEVYGRIWKQRFLPALAEIEHEARVFAEKEQERLSLEVDPEWGDPADIAKQAHEIGLAYYEQYAPIRQGLVNMYAVGLYHLVEQQGFLFFRQVAPTVGTELKPKRDLKFKDVVDWLSAHEVFVAKFQSWPMMEKLNLLSDCVKHAEGRACRRLLEKQPDWFTPIGSILGRAIVRQPLFGQGIYLSESTLWSLTDAVRAFWTELGNALSGRPI
jgi:hypothetical protein